MVTAQINHAVKTFAVDQRFKVRADQNIGRGFACFRVTHNADWVVWSGDCGILDMGGKGQNLIGACTLHAEIRGDKGRVFNRDSHLFHGSD